MNSKLLRTSLSFEQIRRLGVTVPQQLLLRHTASLTFSILAVGLVAGCWIVAATFLLPPDAIEATTGSIPQLSISALDELELWLEERQAAAETGLPLGSRQYFDFEPIEEL